MRRIIAFRLHPQRMYTLANQSSNSGLEDGSPCIPRSLGVSNTPTPKRRCQQSLAATRAGRGFDGSTI